ncbi:MAG TPA: heme exporter protein CcmB [Casimicrobiaceae bacterium]|nr:heme exporter protein CcmB [Casimicrobiaceae bacterium]
MNEADTRIVRSAPIRARLDQGDTDDDASSVFGAFTWGLARDVRIAMRSKAELGVQLLFYVIVVSLFPLSTSPSRDVLMMLGPGVLWTAALLASLLSLPRLFASDFVDGTLEQIALSPRPLPALVLGKIAAHWLTTGLPLAVMAPLLGAQYALDAAALSMLAIALLLGTPILSLLGAIGAALTLGARGGGGLLALLVLPLYAPVLIFGAGAVDAVSAGVSASANLALLGAGLIIAVVALPFAAASAVRIALD